MGQQLEVTGVVQIVPEKISAGVDFTARACLSSYAAPTWSLVLLLRGPENIDLSATADGRDHVFSAPASTTTAWPAGRYWYAIRATDGVATREVERGNVEVMPDLANAAEGYDGRSHARITLDAIEAVIEKRATLDQERYRINNRELYRTPISDLLKLREHYRREVAREDAKARGQGLFGKQLKVHMRPMGSR
jgi:hypothetical protein